MKIKIFYYRFLLKQTIRLELSSKAYEVKILISTKNHHIKRLVEAWMSVDILIPDEAVGQEACHPND